MLIRSSETEEVHEPEPLEPDTPGWEELQISGDAWDEEDEMVDDPYWNIDPGDERPQWARDLKFRECNRCWIPGPLNRRGICDLCSKNQSWRTQILLGTWWEPPPSKAKKRKPTCMYCRTDSIVYATESACRPCYQWVNRNRSNYTPEQFEIELREQVKRRLARRRKRKVSTK